MIRLFYYNYSKVCLGMYSGAMCWYLSIMQTGAQLLIYTVDKSNSATDYI